LHVTDLLDRHTELIGTQFARTRWRDPGRVPKSCLDRDHPIVVHLDFGELAPATVTST